MYPILFAAKVTGLYPVKLISKTPEGVIGVKKRNPGWYRRIYMKRMGENSTPAYTIPSLFYKPGVQLSRTKWVNFRTESDKGTG